jgi:putative phosphoesterase
VGRRRSKAGILVAMSPSSPSLRVAVLSDTHLPTDRASTLPPSVTRELEQADVILHAGDIVSAAVLDVLGAYAPVHAVLGNNDHELVGLVPERLELDLAGVAVAMVHDSGPRTGRPARLRRWFPDAALVVFGHSHEPDDEVGVDGQRLFNPGSALQRRRQPQHTMGLLELADGHIADHRIVVV